MKDLLAGRVDMLFATLPSALEHVRTGRLVALGVTTAQRAVALPEIGRAHV